MRSKKRFKVDSTDFRDRFHHTIKEKDALLPKLHAQWVPESSSILSILRSDATNESSKLLRVSSLHEDGAGARKLANKAFPGRQARDNAT